MHIDVLIATYNRSALLSRALNSLLAADQPTTCRVLVTVIDNRSTDDTKKVVESFMSRFAGRLRYLYESRAGRSHALNCGIAATSGELVAMIDDDEEVDREWLLTIVKAFDDPGTDFIGGPYVPNWGGERPPWFGTAYKAAVGWVDGGSRIAQYGRTFEGMLMGGNAVIRRSVLNRVGPYAADVGRSSDGRLLSCEDRDMFNRLIDAGARGFYRPDLVIHHYVPPERLTKRYFRRWSFWHGVSLAVLDKRAPEPVPYVLGVPRYMIGSALRAGADSLRRIFARREPVQAFKNELAWWDLAGFFYGKHLHRS